MYGDDYEYAGSRLTGTVVRLGDEPVLIGQVNMDGTVEASFLKDFGPITIVKLQELNLSPVSLGMCNVRGEANYLSRMPMRRDWKQGLRKNNFLSFGDVKPHLIGPRCLRDTIVCNYPSLAKCFELVKEGARSAAWCRDWAVSQQGDLIYKTLGIVGTITPDNHNLLKEYSYLEEALMEVL
ncbi:hypothetical protein D3C85_166970 [compost metagenome]